MLLISNTYIEHIGNLSMIIVWGICGMILIKNYRIQKTIKNQFIYLIFGSIFLCTFQIFNILATVTRNVTLWYIGTPLLVLVPLCWYLFIEKASSDKFNTFKAAPALIMVGVLYTTIFIYETPYIILTDDAGDVQYIPNDTIMIMYVLFVCYISFAIYGYYFNLFKVLPKEKRKYGWLALFSFISYSILTVVAAAFLNQYLPGINSVFSNIGLIIITWIIVKHPEVIMGLKTNCFRIAVLDKVGGIPMYTYTWNRGRDLIDNDLFSGMLHGTSLVLKESIKSGGLKSLEVEKANVLLKSDETNKVSVALICEKRSTLMYDAMDNFLNRFCNEFGRFFNSNDVTNISLFERADDFVKKEFYFVLDEKN